MSLSNTVLAIAEISSSEDLTDAVEQVQENIKSGVFQDWLESMMPKALSFFWAVVIALIAWVVGVKVINWLRKVMKKAFEKRGVEAGVQTFADSLVKILLYVVLIVVILNIFGVETTSMSAAIASMGVTVGLALQGSLSNFAGGVLILVLHPFRVGDYIVEDTHGNEGTVTEISIFYTKLLTLENKTVVIPNGTLANASLTNVTAAEYRMLDGTVGVSYNADVREAKRVIEAVVESEEGRVAGQPYSVFVRELNDSSVDIGYRIYTRMSDYWNVRWRMNERIKIALDDAGIEIPFPQVTITNGDKE